MTSIPGAGYFSNGSRTNSEAKSGQDDMLAVLREMMGGSAESTLTLASGSVTPTAGCHAIDTESAAGTDDLANIDTTNMPDGRFLLIRAADATHDVVALHEAGGVGQLSLKGAVDFTLDDTDKWLLLKLTGTIWVEVLRSWGADAPGARGDLGLGAIATNGFGEGLETSGGNARVKLDGSSIERGASGIKSAMPVESKSADYTVVAADRGKMFKFSSAFTLTLTAAATLGSKFYFFYRNVGAGVITIDANASEQIDGQATLTVNPGDSGILSCDGTGWNSIGRASSAGIGSAKVLCKFDAAGVETLSEGVSSVADTATGKWTVNLATPFADTDYVIGVSIVKSTKDTQWAQIESQLAGSFIITHVDITNVYAENALTSLLVSAHGDQ